MISKKRARKGPTTLHLKIRLKKNGAKPTRNEVLEVLDYIIDNGDVPAGWEFHAIDWAKPNSEGQGDVSDVQSFRAVLEVMRDELQFSFVPAVAG